MTPHKFRLTRDIMRITQDELASILGVTRAHINRIENGRTEASPAIQLAMTAMYLLGHPANWPDSIDTIIE